MNFDKPVCINLWRGWHVNLNLDSLQTLSILLYCRRKNFHLVTWQLIRRIYSETKRADLLVIFRSYKYLYTLSLQRLLANIFNTQCWMAKQHKWCDFGDCFEVFFAGSLQQQTNLPTLSSSTMPDILITQMIHSLVKLNFWRTMIS